MLVKCVCFRWNLVRRGWFFVRFLRLVRNCVRF